VKLLKACLTAKDNVWPGIHTVCIPGKTNYPIQEVFLEDLLPQLPRLDSWRSGTGVGRSSPFSQGPLPGVPLDRRTVAEALPQLSPALVQDVVRVHNEKAAMARNRGTVMSLWNLQEE